MAQLNGVLMVWGNFAFQISTVAYDKLLRSDEWRWVTMEHLSTDVTEQAIGKGSTVMHLTGSVYPLFNPGQAPGNGPGAAQSGLVGPAGNTYVGVQQLDSLRAFADLMEPQILSSGYGVVFGQFVLTKLTEAQSYLLDSGAPRKQEFSIELRSYAPNPGLNFQQASALNAADLAALAAADLAGGTPNVNALLSAIGQTNSGTLAGLAQSLGVNDPATATATGQAASQAIQNSGGALAQPSAPTLPTPTVAPTVQPTPQPNASLATPPITSTNFLQQGFVT